MSTVDVINIAADRQKFDTHRQTKLTAPETISRSMHGYGSDRQNLNGSRDNHAPFRDALPSTG